MQTQSKLERKQPQARVTEVRTAVERARERMSWWWSASAFRSLMGWTSRSMLRWCLELSLSIVDDVVWPLVTAHESVALVSMLFFFFVFCGRTV
ncbi:hypothetical protein PRUPE_6G311000 [Prunus persica]|uniref:Uncharacterized protein n=1 Tax=Prunus persica TaxID=3760 RepID=A0A251NY53_PRUPE|nr:hypothetical protein PRUPE_6G311000 [Prunus persica]